MLDFLETTPAQKIHLNVKVCAADQKYLFQSINKNSNIKCVVLENGTFLFLLSVCPSPQFFLVFNIEYALRKLGKSAYINDVRVLVSAFGRELCHLLQIRGLKHLHAELLAFDDDFFTLLAKLLVNENVLSTIQIRMEFRTDMNLNVLHDFAKFSRAIAGNCSLESFQLLTSLAGNNIFREPLSFVKQLVDRNRHLWKKTHDLITNDVLALAAVKLPNYVLLFILDWLPFVNTHREYKKVNLIEGIQRSTERVEIIERNYHNKREKRVE